jgi:hypothetical protein
VVEVDVSEVQAGGGPTVRRMLVGAERRVALRLGRQGLLAGVGAPRLWAVVDEAALRRPVGAGG